MEARGRTVDWFGTEDNDAGGELDNCVLGGGADDSGGEAACRSDELRRRWLSAVSAV